MLQGALTRWRSVHRQRRARLGAGHGQGAHQAGLAAIGLPTPRFAAYRPGDAIEDAIAAIGYPAIVKPSHEGSSVGSRACSRRRPGPAAIELAARYDGELLIEQLIEGDELTIGILDGVALPSIRIVPKARSTTTHAKYVAEDTQYLWPGPRRQRGNIDPRIVAGRIRCGGCAGWGRVDVMPP